jgi:hypothetical protein
MIAPAQALRRNDRDGRDKNAANDSGRQIWGQLAHLPKSLSEVFLRSSSPDLSVALRGPLKTRREGERLVRDSYMSTEPQPPALKRALSRRLLEAHVMKDTSVLAIFNRLTNFQFRLSDPLHEPKT